VHHLSFRSADLSFRTDLHVFLSTFGPRAKSNAVQADLVGETPETSKDGLSTVGAWSNGLAFAQVA